MDNLIRPTFCLKRSRIILYTERWSRSFLRTCAGISQEPAREHRNDVASLARPEFLVEVEAFGVIDKKAPGWGGEILSGEQRSLQECLSGESAFLSGCDGTNPKNW